LHHLRHAPAAAPAADVSPALVRSPERGRPFCRTPPLRFSAPRPAHGLFRPRRRPLHVVGVVGLDVVVLAAVVAFAALGVGPHVANYRTLTMLTASMRPAYPPGSIVVVTEAPASTLRAGDVITFNAPTPDRPVVTHRVVEVNRVGVVTRVITKGDANNANDPWGEFAITGTTVWKARGDVPLAGHAVANLRRPEVQLALTRVLPVALLVWLLVSVWRPAGRADAPA